MKTAVLSLTVALALASTARAACPNACSGHGTCGNYDACSCYANWEGGDCSQRVCPYSMAWVTTPQGDLNYDGDVYDGTVYGDNFAFTAAAHVATDAAPGGTWESWPAFASGTLDEGHFYMECANRGVCDRATGVCKCFDGYEGYSCQRQACPKNCNGHGSCKTVGQLLDVYNTENSASRVYNLWDKEMARSCVCDPGYFGPSCEQRNCPVGDDPLTTTHQYNDIQFVDIYSTTSPSVVGEDLGGSVTFTYTDYLGNTYTTSAVNIQTYDGTSAANDMATNLETAFTSLTGTPIPSISVTAGYCENPVEGEIAVSGGTATTATTAAVTATDYYRCPTATSAGGSQSHVVWSDPTANTNAGMVLINTVAAEGSTEGAGLTARNVNDIACHHITYPECVRFTIEFTGNPGPQELLTVDTSLVSRNSVTGASANIDSSIVKTLPYVTARAANRFGYTLPSAYTTTAADLLIQATQGNANANQVAWTATTATGETYYPVGVDVSVWCAGSSLGTYTVTASVDDTSVTFDRDIVDIHGTCTLGVGTPTQVTLNLESEFITTNVDLTNAGLVGKRIHISTFEATAYLVVASATYDPANTVSTGFILLSGTSGQSASVTSATGTLNILGTSTKEGNECSDRGVCNRETGACKCFKGYSGVTCGTQNALSA